MTRYRLLCLFSLFCLTAHSEIPAGWIVAGDHPKDFEFSVASHETYQEHPSVLIAAKPGMVSSGFGTLMQSINAQNYRGTRLSLSGYLKTQDAGRAQLWMRVDGSDRRVIAFDNMDDRPVVGTTDWSRYQIVLDVPQDSRAIAFGFLLMQKGKAWGSNFKLERADSTLAVTSTAPMTLPMEPANLDFTGTIGRASYQPKTVRVYDIYRADRQEGFHRPRVLKSDIGQFYLADKYNLCGMHVAATTSDEPKLRWDITLSVFVQNGVRMAGISAQTYQRPLNTEAALLRPAISRLEITLPAEHTPYVADLSTRNTEHGAVGSLSEAVAEKLFDVFDAGEPFTMDVSLQSGERESVLIQTPRWRSDPRHVYHGGEAPMRRCVASLVAATPAGSRNQLIELEHPW